MANWASTSYAIEGPKEILEKIELAINNPDFNETGDESWEGYVLKALGIEWVSKDQDRENGKYMRGFIDSGVEPYSDFYDNLGVLRFCAEEAWGRTDFCEVLEEAFPDIKIYWIVEESGCEIYVTNDKEGKYFPDRYWVDIAQNDIYNSEYFTNKEDMYEWLSNITNGRVKSEEDVEAFNSDCKDAGTEDENFIYIHEFEIVD